MIIIIGAEILDGDNNNIMLNCSWDIKERLIVNCSAEEIDQNIMCHHKTAAIKCRYGNYSYSCGINIC